MAEVPQDETKPAPSVWAAGDVAHSWDELQAELPEGSQQESPLVAATNENARLQARIAEMERAPSGVNTTPEHGTPPV